MRRFFKKSLTVMTAALLLLPFLLLPACAQEHEHDLCEASDASVLRFPACRHIFLTTIGHEFRYISETHHSCYEVEIRACAKCPVTEKNDLFFLYTEEHELGVVEGYEVNENGEFIYYGICADCNGRGRTAP